MLRRAFFHRMFRYFVVGASSVFFGSGCRSEIASQSSDDRIVSIGPLSEIPLGRTEYPLFRVIAIREQDALAAVSMVCTHQTCMLKLSSGGFRCPCHGSRFNKRGVVEQGPAVKPLPWYKVSVSQQGLLRVHLDQEVKADWRLKL